MPFFVVPTDPGVTRQVLVEKPGPPLMTGEDYDLVAGDSSIIASYVQHGCTCQEACTLIDTFTPRRDDFL